MGTSIWANLGWLFLRVAAGGCMASFHGYGKVFGGKVHGLANTVAELGFPAPTFFAWCAALSELAGGILVALGLATRGAASCVAFTMLVALYRHRVDPPERAELALLYFAVMLCVALVGAGPFSLDRYVRVRLPIRVRSGDSSVS